MKFFELVERGVVVTPTPHSWAVVPEKINDFCFLEDLPPDLVSRFDGPFCEEEFYDPITKDLWWCCTRPDSHTVRHAAGNTYRILAVW